MFDEASEATLVRSIGRSGEEREGLNPVVDHAFLKVLPDCFQQIKVQLLALGYVERSRRQRSVKDTATYRSLTRVGEHTLMTLRTLRCQAQGD